MVIRFGLSLNLKLRSCEEILQVALIADASDEGLLLVRQVDSDELDTTMLGTYVSNFIQRIDTLFNQGKVLTTSGYTNHILQLLRNDEMVVFSGAPSRLKSPPAAVLQRCMGRMKAWVKLALQVIETEFPSYNIFAAFGVFSLGKKLGSATANDEELNANESFLTTFGFWNIFIFLHSPVFM